VDDWRNGRPANGCGTDGIGSFGTSGLFLDHSASPRCEGMKVW
jgi:hypothetical protein